MPEFPATSITAEPTIEKLAEALAKAQAVIKGAPKSSESADSSSNTRFKFKYADLAEVWEAIRKPLTDNGLSVIQLPGWDKDTGRATLKTILLHTSGQNISSVMSMRPSQDSPQAIGSVLTYLRRYTLAAMVGVVQEDDDGQDASRPETEQRPPEKKPAPKVDQKPAEPTKDTRSVPPARVPDALEEATGIPATTTNAPTPTGVPSAPAPTVVDATSGFPTKEEKKEFVRRMRLYSRNILPKAGLKGDPAEALKAYVLKHSGVADTNSLTKTQWTNVLASLDNANEKGMLLDVL
mgnify:FL=1